MPTPFTHLATAQRLLTDNHLDKVERALLNAERGAFLLGNIAADARVSCGLRREDTHFYVYEQPVIDEVWRVMMRQHDLLRTNDPPAKRAFLAGYVAHLAIDEVWTVEMMRQHFVESAWRTQGHRYVMLHVILAYMDQRDELTLAGWQPDTLKSARPDQWLPFMPDADLADWRDYIAGQIAPDGRSETVDIFSGRITMKPAEFRAILDSRERMHTDLWQYVSQTRLAEVEAQMYVRARQQLHTYLSEAQTVFP